MNTRKTIVNYPFPVNCTPFSEEMQEDMVNYLNNKNKYLHFRDDLPWLLAFDFHLYKEDARKFVATWRKTL